MEIVRNKNYIAVISNKKMDRNGNPKYTLNIFKENENGEYFEIEELKVKSYNINDYAFLYLANYIARDKENNEETIEDIKEKLYEIFKASYKDLDILCKTIQESYNNDTKLELGHEDILPLLDLLDTFDGVI